MTESSDTAPMASHVCPFNWCEIVTGDQDSHWTHAYTEASLRAGNPYHLSKDHDHMVVGVGISYDEGDHPAVVVHLDGGPYNYDYEAHLKLHEAVWLRDQLTKVIEHDEEALRHFVTTITDRAWGK